MSDRLGVDGVRCPWGYAGEDETPCLDGLVWRMFERVVVDRRTGLAWPPTYNAARGVWQS